MLLLLLLVDVVVGHPQRPRREARNGAQRWGSLRLGQRQGGLDLRLLVQGTGGQGTGGGRVHHGGLGVHGEAQVAQRGGLGLGEPATAPERSPVVFSCAGGHGGPWHSSGGGMALRLART